MNPNLLAIIVAFYLSKFNKQGLKNLGFKNHTDAFEDTAKILGTKKNYIKFRRDEFDLIHPWRTGWQRSMDNRVVKAIEVLQDLEEFDLRDIVLRILHDENYRKSEDVKQITSHFSGNKKEEVAVGKFILRAPTGKEWMTAKEHGDKYFLCVVSNLDEKAEIAFIQNPAGILNPNKYIYTSIQTSWSVTQTQLDELTV